MPPRTFLIRLLKSVFFGTPLWRFFLPVMKFDMTIAQLDFITGALESVKNDGAVLEIGVGGGSTSVIINEFMKQKSIERPFYAIDTFFGFTEEDIAYERDNRGKTWYAKTLIAHGIENAHVVQADAKQFDYSAIGPLAFCLLDVDLYKPVEIVLPRLYEILVPGGVIVVDDCALQDSLYDGAGEAYRNFCSKTGMAQELVHDKLGIIRKPLS